MAPLPTKKCTTLADGARLCETAQLQGDRGIYQTLYLMRDLARRDAKDPRVMSIANKLRTDNTEETIYNVWEHMVDNYPYQSDPDDHEFVNAPIHTLSEQFNGQYPYRDCDDLSTAFACLLRAAGIERQYFKAIAWRKNDYTHVYNVVYVPEQDCYCPIDLVMSRNGFGREKTPQIRHICIKV
ncbi:MAG: transglutaminase family protein [Burkholderiaceae bacterium]|nr:transglutaminase family protein [Burkholderiaceae bacterium]